MAGLRILILEDDSTQADALAAAFGRIGHQVFKTNKAEEARAWLLEKKIQFFFVDCLLPGQSGVDLVQELRRDPSFRHVQVVMMSGIFTDAAFVKDAIRTTQAIAFLKKPFEMNEALSLVPEVKDKAVEKVSPRKALYQIFSRGNLSVREKRKLIESLDEIHGFDLPFIYALLSESKMSGHLNIVAGNGSVSGISFASGIIVSVDIADQETFLGKLLIESGFILPDDLEQALSSNSSKRIGEKLILGNLLSPHAFNIVMANQMNIRLSRTLVNLSVKINFVETEVDVTSPNIDSEALVGFLHGWIASKITVEWLKAHYLQWQSHTLIKGPQYQVEHPIFQLPLLSSQPGSFEALTSGKSLGHILESRQFTEDAFLKVLHFLLTKGIVIFSESSSSMSSEDLMKMLNRYMLQFQGKNKVEIFDLMVQITNTSELEPGQVFEEFRQILNIQASGPAENLRSQLLTLGKQACDFVQSGDRDRARGEMAKNEVEMKLKAAQQFEAAKNALQRSQFPQAFDLVTKALQLDSGLAHGKIYLAWAKLGLLEAKVKNFSTKEIEIDLVQASPEDKLDAYYSFVMGLLYRNSGNMPAARKAFEKALMMDNAMIVARRELNRIVNQQGQSKDMLNRDLKDLVSGFFGKKK